jgi:hypothetical protein
MLSLFIITPLKIVAQETATKKEKVLNKTKDIKSCCTAAIPNRFGVKTKSNSKEIKTVTNSNIKRRILMVFN